MPTLYEISTELINLLDSPDEVPEELLDSLQYQMVAKVGDYCKFFLSADAVMESIDKEIERLKRKKEIIHSNTGRAKDRLKMCMEAVQITELNSPDKLFKVKIVNNPARTIIDSEEEIPAKFITVKTERVYNKAAIKEAVKSGELKTGAHLEHTTRLVIR